MARSNHPSNKKSSRPSNEKVAKRAPKRTRSQQDSEKWEKTPADNDISWWSKNPQLMRDAASLPFSQSIGTAVIVPGTQFVNRKDNHAVPGLMTFNYVPTIGASDGPSSPANLAATAIYSHIRSKNSGATNYDAPNLMMYLLIMDGVYGYYSWMTRLYGALRLYSSYNRYLPRLIVEANGVDYDDLLGQMAQFRYYINQYAVRASSLCVPARMSYFKRHFWLSQNIFLDEQTEKAQMYMFVPACFTKYHGIWSDKPTISLVEPLRADTRRTLADIMRIGNSLLQGVLDDADINVMSGDILKAYDLSELFMLSPIPEDYLVVPVYSEEVIAQIHNATVFGVASPEFTTIGTTTQERWDKNQGVWNCIYEEVQTGSNPISYLREYTGVYEYPGVTTPLVYSRGGQTYPLATDQILNSHHMTVPPEEVMEMTRLKVAGRIAKIGSSTAVQAAYYGTEFIINSRVYYASFTRTEDQLVVQSLEFEEFKTTMTKAEVAASSKFMIFKDHPIVTVIDAAPTGANAITISGFIGDLDNYTLVSAETIARIHEAALLSAFDVPLLGSF